MENLIIWYFPDWSFMDWATGPGNALILIFALILDGIIGDPRWFPHPVRGIGIIIQLFDKVLNRSIFSETLRKALGLLTVIFIVGAMFVAGWFLGGYAKSIPYGWLIELFFITILMAQRSMVDHATLVVTQMRQNGISGGRAAVGLIVGREVSKLDEKGISRATIESTAESFTDGVFAPIFWYLLLGLPGLFAYKSISTLDSMVGYKTTKYMAFGMAAAKTDDFASWIPARIAGLIIAFAAIFIPGASFRGALSIFFQDSRNHSSPNAGYTEAAMAGALGLRLLGPRKYSGVISEDTRWLGAGAKDANKDDIIQAIKIFSVACFITGVLVAIMAVIIQFSIS